MSLVDNHERLRNGLQFKRVTDYCVTSWCNYSGRQIEKYMKD